MQDMARKPPQYAQRERNRHGKWVWYFRIGKGKRTRLPDFGADGFDDAYFEILTGKRPAYDCRRSPKGTLAWLVEQWKQSSDWSECATSTKRQRDNILQHVLEKSGRGPYSDITRKDIMAGKEKRKNTPFAANNFLKTMRALFTWAVDCELMDNNPASSVKMFPKETPGFTPWTYEDVEMFRMFWPVGTRERLAMELILSTGLRRGDAVRLGRQHVKDGMATITAEKTKVELFVPISAELQSIISQSPCGDLAFIAGKRGSPLTKESFGTQFRIACRAASVKASAHGLRKLAAVTLAENGGSEMEMQAKFGWKSGRQSQVYTASANRKALAIKAAKRIK